MRGIEKMGSCVLGMLAIVAASSQAALVINASDVSTGS